MHNVSFSRRAPMRIAITGGAGYIGSHTILDILEQGHEALVIDNFANASPEALVRVRSLSNRVFDTKEQTITDTSALAEQFAAFKPEAVIHFAGLKAVGESEEKPLAYYQENLFGTISLLQAMDACDCKRIIFSSSATVYGLPDYLPFDERHGLSPINPYGRTKYFSEQVISDWCKTDPQRSAILLRYFNPVGAHHSGSIGEDPSGIPNNLVPYIAQVAVGRRPALQAYGNDYDTPDGTGVRDYIHISDLASGHVAAVDYASRNTGLEAINLGTGKGASVLEMVAAFERASGKTIPIQIMPRRKGDLDSSYADCQKAKALLNWQAQYTIDDMCRDVWRWQSKNPYGYGQKD